MSIRLVATLADKKVLFIDETPEGVFLYDQAIDGSGSDTWHRTVDDAKDQATYQFDLPREAWLPVRAGISGPINFARKISN